MLIKKFVHCFYLCISTFSNSIEALNYRHSAVVSKLRSPARELHSFLILSFSFVIVFKDGLLSKFNLQLSAYTG